MEEDENNNLKAIFYAFIFYVIGILCRHMGFSHNLKTSYYASLVFIGALMGLLSSVITHMHNPILPTCGPFCLQKVYIPLYFFESGRLVDSSDLKPKIFILNLCLLVPVWIFTGGIIALIGTFLFPYDLSFGAYAVLVLLSMTPDVQATRLFFTLRTSSADPSLMTLLKFEGLFCSSMASFLYHCQLLQENYTADFLSIPFELVFSILIGMTVGQLIVYWLKKTPDDIVIRTSITAGSVFLTFIGCYSFGLAPGVSVLLMSIAIMQAKPSISGKSVEFMYSFLEVFRFMMVTILSVTCGMEIVTTLVYVINFEAIYVSLFIYVVMIVIRLLALLAFRPVYGRYCFNDIHDLLMIWTCNIRGPFNLAMSFAFIATHRKIQNNIFPFVDNILFMLAIFQIILSFTITTPLAGLMMTRLRRRTVDYEKLAMIYRCANVLKDIKASLIDVLRKMVFSADADWDIVQHRTRMKKPFLKRYGYERFINDIAEMFNSLHEKRVRRDSIRVMLRTQRHYLGDQFEQGLVTSKTAKKLTYTINNSYANKSIMSFNNVMRKLAPNEYLLALHRELVEALEKGETSGKRQGLWMIFLVTLFIFTWRLQSTMMSYTEHVVKPYIFIWLFNILFTIVATINLCMLVYQRRFETLTWLLLVTIVFSLVEIASDFYFHQINLFSLEIKWKYYKITVFTSTHFLYYLEIMFSTVTLIMRLLTVAFCLLIAKKCLFKLVLSLLSSSAYVQSEAGLSLMHITKDSLHQLPDCVLDTHLMRNMQEILHKQHLSARQYMGLLELLVPEVMTSLKTHTASRLILNSQRQTVSKMREEGILGDQDALKLQNIIQDKIRRLSHLPTAMKTPSVQQLLENLPDLTGSTVKVSHLLRYGEKQNYSPGQVIVHQAQDPGGIYVILKGVVRLECWTVPSMHSDAPVMGPVYHTTQYLHLQPGRRQSYCKVELTNFHTAGALIGERMILFERPAHKTVRCVTNVQVLFVPQGIIHDMMGSRPQWDGPVSELEENMWRVTAIRQASRLIQGSVSADYLLTRRKIYHMMERSFLIFGDPSNPLHLNVTQYMAVILIHGSVWAVDRQYHYAGPCFIPQRITQLDLMVSRAERTLLLILPNINEGEQEERDWSFLRQREEFIARNPKIEDYDELTPSSDSSDGIPHHRYRDTLALSEPEESVSD